LKKKARVRKQRHKKFEEGTDISANSGGRKAWKRIVQQCPSHDENRNRDENRSENKRQIADLRRVMAMGKVVL